ncbi:MAG: S26 family signal peptidase [Planctomycetota bacterium]|jgi:signal peptidase I
MADSSKKTAPATGKKAIAANIKETLESIVVAFILAFVFRAFIVEAFIIPTGSMAVTLYGEQLTNTCSTCGYEYAMGVTVPMKSLSNRSGVTLCCPNCDTQTDEFKNAQVRRPGSGDRILVHKWPLDMGIERLGPKRWDVTVFKNPKDGTMNYIKRLVGLPGEVLEIIDGDIYGVSIEKLEAEHPGIIDRFDELREKIHRVSQLSIPTNYQGSDFMHEYAALNKILLPLLEIRRKTSKAQRVLWFNVYNHDYLPNYDRLPTHRSTERVGWRPDPSEPLSVQSWNTSGREIGFSSDVNRAFYIGFTGKPIDDFSAYNNDGEKVYAGGRMRRSGIIPNCYVGDLRLRFTWFVDAGDGEILLEMNRDRDRFVASLGVDGTVRVKAVQPDWDLPGHRRLIGEKRLGPFRPGQAVEIEFINVDYQVSLVVDGEEAIVSNDVHYRPLLSKLRRLTDFGVHGDRNLKLVKPSEVRIGARKLRCRLRHVVLERDVYYRSPLQNSDSSSLYYGWPGWGSAGHPIMLRKEPFREYFMLGDNSSASMDSRLWWEIGPHLRPLGSAYRLGTVPEDQLLGKAFFVYWPAGYRVALGGGIGLIPNFGQMRWIR